MLKWSDIWLLKSIELASSTDGDFYVNVIGSADWINHAIITWQEYNNGIEALLDNELIEIQNKKPVITHKASEVLTKYAKFGIRTQMEKIEKALKAEKYNSSDNPNESRTENIYISKGNFNNAVIQYQQKMGI